MGHFGNSKRVLIIHENKSLSDIAGEHEQIKLNNKLVYYKHEFFEVSKEIERQLKIKAELEEKITEIEKKLRLN